MVLTHHPLHRVYGETVATRPLPQSRLVMESELRLEVVRDGDVEDLGVVSRRVITDAGAAAIVNAFRGTFVLSTFNFHALGTGTTAEATSQTALVTELTTQYSTANTRPTRRPVRAGCEPVSIGRDDHGRCHGDDRRARADVAGSGAWRHVVGPLGLYGSGAELGRLDHRDLHSHNH